MRKSLNNHSEEINRAIVSMQNFFDENLGEVGNKKTALDAMVRKYEGTNIFDNGIISIMIMRVYLNEEGGVKLDLSWQANKKLSEQYHFRRFLEEYYDRDYFHAKQDRVSLNQLEIEDVINRRNTVVSDYVSFLKAGYEFDEKEHMKIALDKNKFGKRIPLVDVLDLLKFELKSKYELNEDSRNFGVFVCDEEKEEKFFLMVVQDKVLNLKASGLSFKDTENIREHIMERILEIKEIVELRYQVNQVIDETKSGLLSVFSSSGRNNSEEKCKSVYKLFRLIHEKGERRESEIMMKVVKDLLTDIKKGNMGERQYNDVFRMIKNRDWHDIIKKYESELPKHLFSEYNEEEIINIIDIYMRIYNNYGGEYGAKSRYAIYSAMFQIISSDSENKTKLIKLFRDKLGENFVDDILFKGLMERDRNLMGRGEFESVDLGLYDILSKKIWEDQGQAQYFKPIILSPYISYKVLDSDMSKPLSYYKDMDLDKAIALSGLDQYKFYSYIKDGIGDDFIDFSSVYNKILERFLQIDIDLANAGKLPNLTKYNLDFTVNSKDLNDNIEHSFAILIKTVVFNIYKENPSILENLEKTSFIDLLENIGYSDTEPFMEYITYKLSSHHDSMYESTINNLYKVWSEDDTKRIQGTALDILTDLVSQVLDLDLGQKKQGFLYLGKYPYVLSNETEKDFIENIITPLIKKSIESGVDILEDINSATLEDIFLACCKDEKVYEYIKFHINKGQKEEIVKEFINNRFNEILNEGKRRLEKGEVVDLWEYETLFSIDSIASKIADRFIDEILIKVLLKQLDNNSQVFDFEGDFDLLDALGYSNFTFYDYVSHNTNYQEKVLGLWMRQVADQNRNIDFQKRYSLVHKYASIRQYLNVEDKEYFIKNFLNDVLQKHKNKNQDSLNKGEIRELSEVLDQYEIYLIYVTQEYIDKYTSSFKEKYESGHKRAISNIHSKYCKMIENDEGFDLKNAILEYRNITTDEKLLEDSIDDLENRYNKKFLSENNQLSIEYKKVFDKLNFNLDSLRGLINEYIRYIEHYFVKDKLSSEEKGILDSIPYVLATYILLRNSTTVESEVKVLIRLAKEHYNTNDNMLNYVEEYLALDAMGLKNDYNYLMIMINLYRRTGGKNSIGDPNNMEELSIGNNFGKVNVKMKKGINFNTYYWNTIIAYLYVLKMNNILTKIMKQDNKRESDKVVKQVLELQNVLDNIPYDNLVSFRSSLADINNMGNIIDKLGRQTTIRMLWKYVR